MNTKHPDSDTLQDLREEKKKEQTKTEKEKKYDLECVRNFSSHLLIC